MKKIWIMNHYATDMFENKGGRHFWFAKNLMKQGYDPTVFCANTFHQKREEIDLGKDKHKVLYSDEIPFVFIKTKASVSNGMDRIKNMTYFYFNLLKVAKRLIKKGNKPDLILASSVHPLTLVAGIKLGKKFDIPVICEIRDLWPESIVAYSKFSKKNLIIKLLYLGEKWIYKKADRLIFTFQGGTDYMKDQGWEKVKKGSIDMSKVYHINNGVDIDGFDYNAKKNVYKDYDLDNLNLFKIVYTGSIRKANNLKLIIDAAKLIREKGYHKIRFIIFGEGNEKDHLLKRCLDERIDNVIFKGEVEKKFVPNILSKTDITILNYSNHEIWKYGGSQNKIFEYLASGKPILSTITMGYDIIEKYNAGISLKRQDPETISEAVISLHSMNEMQYKEMAHNARKAALDYDFNVLTKKLIDIFDSF